MRGNGYIKIRVRTTWKGQVGIHQKYLKSAKETGLGLEIWVGEERMILSAEDVKAKLKGKSEEQFTDRFTGEKYHIYYYDWKPTTLQNSLFGK